MTTTRNLAVLLTDIKGFTDRASHISRSELVQLIDKHREIVLPILEGRGGRLIKTIGDAFLMVFDSPTDGVLAGVAVQEALRAYNDGKDEARRIDVRIAINAGEVTLTDGDIYGEPVNITSRIEGIAEAGEVYFTEAVYLAMNKSEVPSSEVGLLQLKGIPEKVRVYKVRRESPVGEASKPAPAPSKAVEASSSRGEKAVFVAAAPPAAAPVAAGAGSQPPAPQLWRRAAALAIDVLFCGILAGAIPGSKSDRVHFEARGAEQVIEAGGASVIVDPKTGKVRKAEAGKKEDPFGLVFLLYQLLFLTLWGTTPGGRVNSLKIAACDGTPLSWKHNVPRALMSVVSAYVVGLGYVWALWDKDRKGWHDKVSGTMVVDRSC